MKPKKERIDDSRQRIREAMNQALGVYIEEEAKKTDSWRDLTYYDLFRHLRHELQEIERSDTPTKQLHNALDACGLSAILAAKVIEEMEK